MPSVIVKTIFFDLDKLAWTLTAGGNALLQPLTIGQNDTIDFNVQFIKSGAAQTLTSPTFTAGIKVLNGFSDSFVVQFGAPTGTPPTYTFTATISSTELSAALLTGAQFAIEFRDSTNGIVTLPALTLNIVASYTISGTTPTSANGTLNVSAGKTVTFPQSLTFPSALGTNGFQLTTDGAGALTWAASGALTDGDKGDITVSNSGATFTIDNDVVGLAKLAHMPTARVIGRTTAGNGSPELLTISGTGSVAMTNTPTLVTPVLGDATGTSITVSDGVSVSGANGYLEASGANGFIEALGANAFITGRSIRIWNGSQNTILAQSAATSDKTATFPNVTGTVVVTAATSATATQALFAQATGFPAYRAIATADIATALTTPGAIGGTTASTGAFTTLAASTFLDIAATAATAGTATAGVIRQAGTRLLHSYGTQNLFLGDGAGNFTLTGSANTGIGRATLGSITSGGKNIGLGDGTMFQLTSGSDNLAIGRSSLNVLVSGSQNTAVGSSALPLATGGSNVGIGHQAGYRIGSGNNNVSIGQNSLLNAVNSYATLSSTSSCTLIGTLAEVTTSGQTTASYRTAIGSESNATADNQVMLGRAADIVTLPGGLVTVPIAQTATTAAVSVAVTTTALTTTGVAQAITLANGTNGQIKIITHIANGGTGTAVLTPATSAADYNTITFSSVGDTATLQYHTTGGWYILSLRGAVAA